MINAKDNNDLWIDLANISDESKELTKNIANGVQNHKHIEPTKKSLGR